jgi:hypothetical protein
LIAFFKTNRKIILNILRILMSILLLALLFSEVSLAELGALVSQFSPRFFLLLPLAFAINLWFSAFKWKLLLRDFGIEEKVGKLFKIYLIGVFFSNFLPSTIGGDGYRFLRLNAEHAGSAERILSSILLERGYGYLATLVVNLVLTAWFWDYVISSPLLLWLEVIILIGSVGITFFWVRRRMFTPLFDYLRRWNIFQRIDTTLALFKQQSPRTILLASLLSLGFLFVSGFVWQLYYFWTLGMQPDILLMLYLATLVIIVGVIPLTISGLGLVEWAQMTLMKTQGIPSEAVLVASFAYRIILVMISSVGGLVYLGQSLTLFRNKQRSHRKEEDERERLG